MGPTFERERALGGRVAGLDEAGRGPWAGPICAAAVVFEDEAAIPPGLDDSKKLSEAARFKLADAIRASGADWGVGWASAAEVDRWNPIQASFLAMARALARLERQADSLLIDGPSAPSLGAPATAVVRGDGLCLSIAAASILAKTARDAYMAALHRRQPHYGWASNKGYGAPAHREGLERIGVSRHHRLSYEPVAARLSAIPPRSDPAP